MHVTAYVPQPNWGFNADANTGHGFAIFMASVGALRPYGLRRRLTWALGFGFRARKFPYAITVTKIRARELPLVFWHNWLRARGHFVGTRESFRYALERTKQHRASGPLALSICHVAAHF